jgi:hypothetical protein
VKNRIRKHPPAYLRRAEYALWRALRIDPQRNWADAVLWLGRAFDRDPRLTQDATARHLAHTLTDFSGQRATQIIADVRLRQELIRYHTTPQGHGLHELPFQRLVLLFTLVFVATALFLGNVDEMRRVITDLFAPQAPPLKATIAGIDYLIREPAGEPPADGWPVLVALPGGETDQSAADAARVMQLLTPISQNEGVLLIVPDTLSAVQADPERDTDALITQLDAGLAALADAYAFALHEAGPVLFGFAEGGALATLYAQTFPSMGVVTSGATYLHAQDAETPVLFMYGSGDAALTDVRSLQPDIFDDIREWQAPLDYIVLDGLPRILTLEQVPLIIEFVTDAYLQHQANL